MEATASSEHADSAQRMLDAKGVSVGPVRVAVGRTGVALGFSDSALIHVSWWAIAAALVVIRLLHRR